MKKPPFTLKQLVSTVKQLAKENPDNIYPKPPSGTICSYRNGRCSNGSKGCIFGQAFERLGLPRPEDGDGAITNILQTYGFAPGTPEMHWCNRVQCEQDHATHWKNCIPE